MPILSSPTAPIYPTTSTSGRRLQQGQYGARSNYSSAGQSAYDKLRAQGLTAAQIAKRAKRAAKPKVVVAEVNDDLASLASKLGVEQDALAKANPDMTSVQAGMVLNLPDNNVPIPEGFDPNARFKDVTRIEEGGMQDYLASQQPEPPPPGTATETDWADLWKAITNTNPAPGEPGTPEWWTENPLGSWFWKAVGRGNAEEQAGVGTGGGAMFGMRDKGNYSAPNPNVGQSQAWQDFHWGAQPEPVLSSPYSGYNQQTTFNVSPTTAIPLPENPSAFEATNWITGAGLTGTAMQMAGRQLRLDRPEYWEATGNRLDVKEGMTNFLVDQWGDENGNIDWEAAVVQDPYVLDTLEKLGYLEQDSGSGGWYSGGYPSYGRGGRSYSGSPSGFQDYRTYISLTSWSI